MLNEEFDTFATLVELANAAPSAQQYEVYKMLHDRLETQLAKLEAILKTDLPAFDDLARKLGVPLLYLSKQNH